MNVPASQDFDGKKVLVTGATRGIGRGIARTFLDAGAHVVLSGRAIRDSDPLLTEPSAVPAIFIPADLTSSEDAVRLGIESAKALDGLDVLVHCAGIYPEHPLSSMPIESWNEVLQVNLTSTMLLVRSCLPALLDAAEPRIVVVSSITGPRTALPALSHYAASKAGVEGFIRAAALELGPDRVTINAIAPGSILTDSLEQLLGEDGIRATAEKIPLKRLGTPEDVAAAALFLASAGASFITGHSLVVDGGQTLVELY